MTPNTAELSNCTLGDSANVVSYKPVFLSWYCISKLVFRLLNEEMWLHCFGRVMAALTVLQVREFSNVIQDLLITSRLFLQEDRENFNCPCLSLLPSDFVFCDIESSLARLQDNDSDLEAVFRRLTCIFYQIRDCVRTHTLRFLDEN